MNTNSVYRITNEQTGAEVRNSISFPDAKKFVFQKLSKNKFDTTCLADYRITDIATGDYLPLQHLA